MNVMKKELTKEKRLYDFVMSYKFNKLCEDNISSPEYYFDIHYETSNNPSDVKFCGKPMPIAKVTTIELITYNDNTNLYNIYVGSSRRHPNDEYIAGEGIYYALARALSDKTYNMDSKNCLQFKISGITFENLDMVEKMVGNLTDAYIKEHERISNPKK